MFEMANVRTITLKKQDDDNTNHKISDDNSDEPGESTLSSDIKEDHLDYQPDVLHLDWEHHAM